MTQALNLANFANTLNSSGQTSNSGLQNSSVNVTAGTGLSGGGSVPLGGSVTLNNAGVTSVSAGTGISVSSSTGGVTIQNTAITDPQTTARAWVLFSGIYSSIVKSYNVSSITYVYAGNYTINFTNPLPDSNYVAVGSNDALLGSSNYVTAFGSNFAGGRYDANACSCACVASNGSGVSPNSMRAVFFD